MATAVETLPAKTKDLLRGKSSREELLASILGNLNDATEQTLQDIAQFIDILDNFTGCTSPAEALITDLVHAHYSYGGLAPDIVENRYNEFRIDYNAAMACAKRMIATYPDKFGKEVQR